MVIVVNVSGINDGVVVIVLMLVDEVIKCGVELMVCVVLWV